MEHGGSFISEVYREGRTFYFEAIFDPRQWAAYFWDEDGAPHGAIACSAPSGGLQGDALEDAVCDWVHRAVTHEVGFVLDNRQGPHRLASGQDAHKVAANADAYGVQDGCVTLCLQTARATKAEQQRK